MPNLHIRTIARIPSVSASDIQPRDYVILSDDNAGRIESVRTDGHTVHLTVSHLVNGTTSDFSFDAREQVSVYPR